MPTAELVLSRFPRHLDADQPGKVIGDVVGALAAALDSQISQVGKVRRAHRSAEVEQRVDLLRLGGLHAFDDRSMVPVERRVAALDPVLTHDAWLAIARRVLVAAIADQRHHSATVDGLLAATADYLGCDVATIQHEGFWHLARCRDNLRDDEQLVALEENPPYLADVGPIPRRHADRFHITRKGFATVPCTVIVKGVDDRTMAPMIVNVDDGEGIASTVTVPAGALLRFERDGRVELDGSSVAGRSFIFSGAVFAEPGAHPKDFVFADADDPGRFGDRDARYTVTAPLDDGFDISPSFPHGDVLLRALRLDRAETRFAVFVAAGVFGGRDADGADVLAAPKPIAGFFDESLYQPDPTGAPSFEIGFEWEEREAYAVRVWLPLALQQLDVEGEPSLREVIRLLLDRHRAAGVHVYVEHADPRWILGTGVVRDLASDDALGVVVAGTGAWTDDTTQPTPGPN